MIHFFRKIRHQLFTNNKFSKYLLCAVGEIILVVIGILIALQINNTKKLPVHPKKLYEVELQNFFVESIYLTSGKESVYS